MDYVGQKCPVCGLDFTENDDIVVCPICGTPHHRNCYDELGRCVNEEKHSENYDWNKENKPKEENKCKNCGFVNSEEMLFCGKCGTPLGKNNAQNVPPQQKPPMGNPFITQDANGTPHLNIDPLAGIPPETTFDEDVTAQDLADVTKVNSFYYMNVFNRLKKMGSGKFNFAAFFFGSGIWWIYRKMYVVGIILFAFTLLATFLSIYLLPTSIEITNSIINQYGASPTQDQMLSFVNSLTNYDKFAFFLPAILNIINLVIMFASGFLANRLYYKHCIKVVKKVKKIQQDKSKIKSELTKLGGINSKAAFACAACIFAITIAQLFI